MAHYERLNGILESLKATGYMISTPGDINNYGYTAEFDRGGNCQGMSINALGNDTYIISNNKYYVIISNDLSITRDEECLVGIDIPTYWILPFVKFPLLPASFRRAHTITIYIPRRWGDSFNIISQWGAGQVLIENKGFKNFRVIDTLQVIDIPGYTPGYSPEPEPELES